MSKTIFNVQMFLKRFLYNKSSSNVIIIRGGALGDVLCIEPIARKLKYMGYRVFIGTHRPDVFLHQNNIITAIFKGYKIPPSLIMKSIIINLDSSYENEPLMHIVDAYIKKVQSILPNFSLSEDEKIPIYNSKLLYSRNINQIKTICVNSEGTWPSRTYNLDKWKQFILYLKERGYSIIEIGHKKDYYLDVGENYYGKLDLDSTIELMSKSDMYLGFDGGLMHFAQSIGLPMFIIFGCTCPIFRIHNWNIAKVLWKNNDELNCAGCHHRRKAPNFYTKCDKNTIYCLDWPVEKLISAFQSTSYGNKPRLMPQLFNPIE